MARINLSVTEEIKDLMDRWDGVNWSRVAAEAFAFHLEILRLKGENMETAAGIERLRASKKSNSERECAEGVSAGKEWALETAEYDELKRVAELRDTDVDMNHKELFNAIAGDDDVDFNFMVQLFGSAEPSDSWVEGFVDGAHDVFIEI